MQKTAFILAIALTLLTGAIAVQAQNDSATFENSAVPLFRKYCVSCHSNEDQDGGLSLETAKGIARGGDNGPALVPGDAKSSRLVRMMLGQLEPKMPPDDMQGPSQQEMENLMAWIDDGAIVDANINLTPQKLTVPEVKSQVSTHPITDLDWSKDGKWIAVARYRTIDILAGDSKKLLFQLKDHPGKVNSVEFSPDSKFVLAGTGITGLKGVAIEWDLNKQKKSREFAGHQDMIYSAVYSPNSTWVATAGYDRKIVLWNRDQATGNKNPSSAKAKDLAGHNDAVYDLKFSHDSSVLASASGDQTVKLWSVESGKRLDTLGQPLKEQFVATIDPADQFVVGAGRDNRIRLWQLAANQKSPVHPLLVSRFAHEASIVSLTYSADGKFLVSSAEDGTIKVWTGDKIQLLSTLPRQSDVAFGMSLSPKNELAVGRMDGTLDFYALSTEARNNTDSPELTSASGIVESNRAIGQPLKATKEAEPNSKPLQAQRLELPAEVSGVLHNKNAASDDDYFRFAAQKGETWVFETNASRSKSPADTKLEILTEQGQSIRRVTLQAVRDSYFTFRGKDANTSDDFRVHNWEEMELNELLFCNGEVVKLFLYPRGPDSGFKVYPGFGTRHNYFDTTPVAHALQEPCYIVKAFPPGAKLTPNGLPVFHLNYENDDDAERKMGSDSKLFFTAPATGKYLVKVSDARGFQGEGYTYKLIARSPKPDFFVNFGGKKMTLKRGSGREFSLKASRTDNFKGAIDILFENVPAGIQLPDRITIQKNHYQAFATYHVRSDAAQPTPEQIKNIKVTAVATINGQEVRKDLGKVTQLKLEDEPRIQTRIVKSFDKLSEEQKAKLFTDEIAPVVLKIKPGTTVSAHLVVKRHKHGGDIDFGNAESGRNLPHGVFVDNIGLNGLRIIKGQGDVREIFITAAKWVPEQTRVFHLRANNIDGETTLPVILKVEK